MLMIEQLHVIPYKSEGLDVLWLIIGVGAFKPVFIESADSEEEAYRLIEKLRDMVVEPRSMDHNDILTLLTDDRIKNILQ